MEYFSTRDSACRVSAAEAIITGLAPDGGLFVPAQIPALNFEEMTGYSYQQVAQKVLQTFLPDYDPAFLSCAIQAGYGENFGGRPGHMEKVAEGLYSLELWHGPTAAFKDCALQIMPKLLVQARSMQKEEGETLILVATSGDTGGAALAGYKNLPGVRIAVFYPVDGTSELQRLQMATAEGENVAVYAVQGNFDDAQRGVKTAFTDKKLAEALWQSHNARLSSANSINWGRLVPQVVYYANSYLKLCADGVIRYGEEVDFSVPTGNFGDIMAGWYAKQMGLPIRRLICASNKNNVLSEFLQTGHYNANRQFFKTTSPSMDIVVSSNLERLLYHTSQSNQEVKDWMNQLATDGSYSVEEEVLKKIRGTFAAGWAQEEEVFAQIESLYRENGYLCDPHTAVAFKVAKDLRSEGDKTPLVVLSTASPYKFSGQVLAALGQKDIPADEFAALRMLEQVSGAKAPASLKELNEKPVRFTQVIPAQAIAGIPLEIYK